MSFSGLVLRGCALRCILEQFLYSLNMFKDDPGERMNRGEARTLEDRPSKASLGVEVAGQVSRDECLNCGTTRTGSYCSHCGQKFVEDGLTARRVLRDFAERAFDLDQGLLYTIRSLITDPGLVSRNYVEGLRRPYVNPLGYLILTVALSVVVVNVIGDQLLEVMFAPFAESENDSAIMGDMTAAEFFDTFIEPSITYMTIGMAVPMAGVIWFFYRSSHRYTFTETLVPVIFACAQATLYSTVFYPAMILLPRNIGFVLTQLAILITCLVVGQAAYGFYDRRPRDFVLGFISAGAGYLLFMILFMILTFIVVVIGLLTGIFG